MIITDIDPLTLPSLPLNERSHLPYCPAVYFVVANNNVLYIGQTANLHDRWLAHHRWGQLKELNELVRIAWLECGEHHLLTEIEAALISHFEPPLNGSDVPYGKPRATVTFDLKDYKELQQWADSEFRSVPQLIFAIVKKALIERKQNLQKE